MFDVGITEMVLVAVVALIVLGPERLPKAARFAGLWIRKARAQWYSVRSEFEREMAADDMRRTIAAQAEHLKRDLSATGREIDESMRAAEAQALAAAATTPPPSDPESGRPLDSGGAPAAPADPSPPPTPPPSPGRAP